MCNVSKYIGFHLDEKICREFKSKVVGKGLLQKNVLVDLIKKYVKDNKQEK